MSEPFHNDDDDDADDDDDLDEERVSNSSSSAGGRMHRKDGSGPGLDDSSSIHKRNTLPQLVAHAAASSNAPRPGPGVNGAGGSNSSTNIINGRAPLDGKAAGGAFGRWL
jgi:hypothetical protein